MKTINTLDMKLCVNNSWSGSHVTTFKDKAEKAACMDRATLLHNDNLEIDPDIIIFAIGANDALGSYEIGTYNGLSDVYDGQNYIGDPTLFAPAYAMMLHKTKMRYPDADIYLFSMLNWPLKKEGGTPIVEYTNVVKQIADEFDVTYVDLYNETDISPETAQEYFYDKVHPTPAGFTEMSDCLIRVLKEKYNVGTIRGFSHSN
jgi:lysophospholipase L1-like esterase